MVKGRETSRHVAWVLDFAAGEVRAVRVAPVFDRVTGAVDPARVWVLADDPGRWPGEHQGVVGEEVFPTEDAALAYLARRLRAALDKLGGGPYDAALLARAGWGAEEVRHLQGLDPTAVLLLALEQFDAAQLREGMILGRDSLRAALAGVLGAVAREPRRPGAAMLPIDDGEEV